MRNACTPCEPSARMLNVVDSDGAQKVQGCWLGAYCRQAVSGFAYWTAGRASPSKSNIVRLSLGVPSPGVQPTPGIHSGCQ